MGGAAYYLAALEPVEVVIEKVLCEVAAVAGFFALF